jgi:glycerol-3-phosphate acyltransferase PlsY
LQLSLLFIFTWIVVSLIFKYSSVSSMFSSLTVFVVSLIRETAFPLLGVMTIEQTKNISLPTEVSFILFIFFILIVFTHRKNISNLKNKTEQKIRI